MFFFSFLINKPSFPCNQHLGTHHSMEQSFAGTSIFEVGFANGPILLPITGMGTGTAQLWAGKQLLVGRSSIAASSEQSMPFLGFFWLGVALVQVLWAPIALEFVKITAKYVLFLSLCQAGIISEMREHSVVPGRCGGTCALIGVPHSISLGWIWITDPNIQSSAQCWTQPCPTVPNPAVISELFK